MTHKTGVWLSVFVLLICANFAIGCHAGEANNPQSTTNKEQTKRIELIAASADVAPITLQIPTRFSGPGIEPKPVHSYAFYITSTDMKGMHEKENSDQAHCVGYCRGFTIIYIANSSGIYDSNVRDIYKYIYQKDKYKLVKSGKFSSIVEEYDVMWKKYPFKPWPDQPRTPAEGASREQSRPSPMPIAPPVIPPPGYVSESTYNAYLKQPWPAAHIVVFRKNVGEPLIVECKMKSPVPLCKFFGRSDINKHLSIEITFRYEDIKYWPDLKKKIFSLVEGFIN